MTRAKNSRSYDNDDNNNNTICTPWHLYDDWVLPDMLGLYQNDISVSNVRLSVIVINAIFSNCLAKYLCGNKP